MTRLLKGWSISSRSDAGAPWMACTAANERPTCWRSLVIAPTVASSRRTPMKTPPRPRRSIKWSLMSHLHLDHFAHPEDADDHVDEQEDDQRDPDRVGPQRADVLLPDEQQVEEEEWRQAAEDPRRQPPLGGEDLHLAPQPFAFAERGRNRREDLGEVAADLSLDPDGHDDPLEVDAAHARADPLQRILDRHAEAGLDEGPVEL